MTTLTVTSKGQVTLRKEVLKHLGIGPGDKIDIDLRPNGTAVARAAAPKPTGSIEDVFGMLGPWKGPPVSIEITPDSNVLIRALMNDDPVQAKRARTALRDAAWIAITLPTLCEFVWVMRSFFKKSRSEVGMAVRSIVNQGNVSTDLSAVNAGLRCLETGSDFADGVIAFEGQRLGGEVFVTFDRKAAEQLATAGAAVELLQ